MSYFSFTIRRTWNAEITEETPRGNRPDFLTFQPWALEAAEDDIYVNLPTYIVALWLLR